MRRSRPPERSPIIGIDLGTTNSVVAACVDGHAVALTDESGRASIPSEVHFSPDGTIAVGHAARRARISDPANTIFSAKRLIGRDFRSRAVQSLRWQLPYLVVEGPNHEPQVVCHGERHAVTEVAAIVVRHLKELAERRLGCAVERAVISVPAHFNDAQRTATRLAGELAGLEVVRILNEPTAAALAHGATDGTTSQRVLVYDFGGGTFDATVLDVRGKIFEVLATGGDSLLGGDDFDRKIVGLVLEGAKRAHADLARDPSSIARLLVMAERLKCTLSEALTAHGNLVVACEPPVQLDLKLSRERFERVAEPLIEHSLAVCHEVCQAAGLLPEDLDEVILCGGTSRIPRLRDRVAQLFGRQPRRELAPEEAVALGAAVLGHVMSEHDDTFEEQASCYLIDVAPGAFGLATVGGYSELILERNAALPAERTRLFTTSADNQTEVRIEVCQGSSRLFSENVRLGELCLFDLEPRPRGDVQVEVTFTLNVDGILEVRARDAQSGREERAAIHLLGVPQSGPEQLRASA